MYPRCRVCERIFLFQNTHLTQPVRHHWNQVAHFVNGSPAPELSNTWQAETWNVTKAETAPCFLNRPHKYAARQRLLMNASYGQISFPPDGTISRNPFFTMAHETHICQRLAMQMHPQPLEWSAGSFDTILAHLSHRTIEVSPGIGVICQILCSADK